MHTVRGMRLEDITLRKPGTKDNYYLLLLGSA